MTSKVPPIYLRADRPKTQPKPGYELPTGGLPPHVARITLPNGTQIGELSLADVARLCAMLGIPDTGPDRGKAHNAQKLSDHLDMIGRRAAEDTIRGFIERKLAAAANGEPSP